MITYSGLLHAAIEDDSPPVHHTDPEQPEESDPGEGRAHSDDTSVAAARRKIRLPASHGAATRARLVPPRPYWQGRQALA